MDTLMSEMVKKLITVLGKYQKSEFEIVKIHAMYLSYAIRRSGIPVEYSTNLYEHLHILVMKVPYRASNKKDFVKQMARHHQRLLAIGRQASTSSDVKDSNHEKESALDKAVTSRVNVMMGARMRFQVEWLMDPLEKIPLCGRELLLAQPETTITLKQALDTYNAENDLQPLKMLELKNGMAIPAGVGERFGDWSMIARATHNFHNSPYFSDITIQMEGAREPTSTAYAQLICSHLKLSTEMKMLLTQENLPW